MIKDFYEAWKYLDNHVIFQRSFAISKKISQYDYNDENSVYFISYFNNCLDIEITKVNPITKERNPFREEDNTLTQVWIECGPYIPDDNAHDIDLDCGGNTFEEAIIKLANLVQKKYSDDVFKAVNLVRDQYIENSQYMEE